MKMTYWYVSNWNAFQDKTGGAGAEVALLHVDMSLPCEGHENGPAVLQEHAEFSEEYAQHGAIPIDEKTYSALFDASENERNAQAKKANAA